MLKMSRHTYKVDIAQFVEEEVVDGGRGEREVVRLETSIARTHRVTESTQDPLIQKRTTSLRLREQEVKKSTHNNT